MADRLNAHKAYYRRYTISTLCICHLLCMLNFTGTQALCADIHLLHSAVHLNRYSLYVGVPDSV